MNYNPILKFNIVVIVFVLLSIFAGAGDTTIDAGDIYAEKDKELFLSLRNTEASGHDWRLVSAGSLGGIGVGKFAVYDATSSLTRLTIDTNGKVGIGTPAPAQLLHVVGGAGVDNGIQVSMGSIANLRLTRTDTTAQTYIIRTESDGTFKIMDETASGSPTRFLIDTSGKVGIGTPAPKAKLDVGGEVKVGNTGLTCDSDAAGALRYNSGVMEFCDGTDWQAITPGGGATPLSGGGIAFSDDFESSFGNWNNVGGDNCDWIRDQDGTPSSNTGPSVDHTLGTTSGWYAYVETSSGYCYSIGNTAYLESPAFDANLYPNLQIDFWYHMYGSNIGTLYVDVFDGTWNNGVWSKSGNQGNTWFNAVVDLSSYSGNIKVRFRNVAAGSYRGDTAIDDVVISG